MGWLRRWLRSWLGIDSGILSAHEEVSELAKATREAVQDASQAITTLSELLEAQNLRISKLEEKARKRSQDDERPPDRLVF